MGAKQNSFYNNLFLNLVGKFLGSSSNLALYSSPIGPGIFSPSVVHGRLFLGCSNRNKWLDFGRFNKCRELIKNASIFQLLGENSSMIYLLYSSGLWYAAILCIKNDSRCLLYKIWWDKNYPIFYNHCHGHLMLFGGG